MNVSDVERRLEALAAGSASPDVPPAILDRMAQLETGAERVDSHVRLVAPATRRVRSGGGPRARGLTLLGVAAVLAIAGGLTYVVGSQPGRTPAPTRSEPAPTGSGPAPSASSLATMYNEPDPTPPFNLGQWRRVYTFTDGWQFGHMWSGGGAESGVSLSWQNNEIVGLATRYRDNQQHNCVLRSKDGSAWTCSDLPTPTGEACGPGPCPEATGLAVREGRWVVTGYSSFRRPSEGDLIDSATGLPDNRRTLLIWTSKDGRTWTEQPGARSTNEYMGAEYIGAPGPPTLLTTSSGFLMSRCADGRPGVWISADGLSWKPAAFAPGSQEMTCATLAPRSAAGYMAIGQCQTSNLVENQCVAFSADGTTWTTSDPAAGAPSVFAGQLRIEPGAGLSYVGGHWVAYLDYPIAQPDLYYRASSTDGRNWSLSPAPWPDWLSTEPGLNESDYHPAVFAQKAAAGYWGLNTGPIGVHVPASPSSAASAGSSASPGSRSSLIPARPSTYWSATGWHWQTVSDAPPGWPIALVETPTGLVAFMTERTDGAETTSVWVAPRK